MVTLRRMLPWLVVAVIPFTTASSCGDNKPIMPLKGVVEAKREPCGADHICQKDEVTCYQLQIKSPTQGTVFRCVSQTEWGKYKKGDAYP